MFETEESRIENSTKKYFGKYPGVVLSNDPPQNGPHRGELLVEVHGILEETPDGKSQRPIQVMAKPCFPPSFFFIPEEKDNVWVEFGAGDINNPIWTGVWYPQGKTPNTADAQAPAKFQKIIRTASGQVIQLDDSDKNEKLVIRDEKNNSTVTLDANGITVECADKTVSITCKNMEIHGDVNIDGKVHITGNTDVDNVLTVGTGPKTTIKSNEITGG
ncbi:phage baseplate assembly protein V [Pelotomaculum terephthalicicum JT]|uniref:phage baseplate assembly protein V n=1 Tax=Pelotomaculum terephthalicicum TaxID=206393 RepID=UPI001F03810A|nr:phage baseplate assembly protein V [Pelotomaculum terephthalicicum]MCG9967142.1 phage baseplate assembly protein V [Pelotomaculum terephthalicicum JT]